jgi:hypothetical protein
VARASRPRTAPGHEEDEIKGQLVDGFDLDKEIARLEEATCGNCTRAKQRRRSFPKNHRTPGAYPNGRHDDADPVSARCSS